MEHKADHSSGVYQIQNSLIELFDLSNIYRSEGNFDIPLGGSHHVPYFLCQVKGLVARLVTVKEAESATAFQVVASLVALRLHLPLLRLREAPRALELVTNTDACFKIDTINSNSNIDTHQ